VRVAVVGAGVSGLHAAWRLSRQHDVTLYEAADYAGGHTATVDVEWEGRTYGVDTGFIVFNDWTYPNFIAMLRELGVAWQPSNMSFSLSCERTGLEYNGTSLNSLFAQRRNALRPSFLRMIADILRFNARSRALVGSLDGSLTLGAYLEQGHYSQQFVEHYIVPMGRAIWSAEASTMLGFPARFFIEFFDRHGFLSVGEQVVIPGRAGQRATRQHARVGVQQHLVGRVRESGEDVALGGGRRLEHRQRLGRVAGEEHVIVLRHLATRGAHAHLVRQAANGLHGRREAQVEFRRAQQRTHVLAGAALDRLPHGAFVHRQKAVAVEELDEEARRETEQGRGLGRPDGAPHRHDVVLDELLRVVALPEVGAQRE